MAETVTFLVMGLPSEKLVKIIEYYIDWWPKKRYKVFLDLFKTELKNVEKNSRKNILNKLSEDVLSEIFSLAVKIFPMQDAFLPSGEVDFFLLQRSVSETLTHTLLNVCSLYGEVDDIKGLCEALRISIKKFKEKLFGSLSSLGIPEIMEEIVNLDPENYVIFSASFERTQAGGARVKDLEEEKGRILEFTPSVVKSESEIKKYLKWPSMDRIPGIGESNQIKYETVKKISEFPCLFEENEFYGLRAGDLKTGLCKMVLPLSPNIIEVLEDFYFRENLLEIEKKVLDQLMSQMAFDPDFFRFLPKEDKLGLLIFLEHLKRDIIHPINSEKKNELLATLAVVEGRIVPSDFVLNELLAMKPVLNRALQFELYLQLGYNFLLSGNLIKSVEAFAEAHRYAEEEDQTVFVQILEALVKVQKSQFDEAVEDLMNCHGKTSSPKIKGISLYYIGMVYFIQGALEDAYRFFDDAEGLFQTEEDVAAIQGRKGVCALKLEMYEEAFQEFRKLESFAKNNGNKEFLAAAYEALGMIFSINEKLDEATKYYGMALEIDKELKDDKAVSDDYSKIGTVYYKKERLDDALKYYERALEIHKRMNEKRKAAIEYNNIGVTLKAKGNLGKALKYFEEALKINDELENMTAVATNCNNIASVLSESGKRKEALTYIERALILSKELGDYDRIAEKYTDMGKILADEKDFDSSLEYFEKSLKIHKDLDNKEEMIKDYSNMGLVLVNMGEIIRAVNYFEICLKLSEELNYLKWVESTVPTIFKSYGFLKKKDPGKTFYLRILEKFPELTKEL